MSGDGFGNMEGASMRECRTRDPEGRTHLTIKEFAAQRGLSRVTVWRAIKSGALRAARFGRLYRVPLREAEAYDRRGLSNATNNGDLSAGCPCRKGRVYGG